MHNGRGCASDGAGVLKQLCYIVSLAGLANERAPQFRQHLALVTPMFQWLLQGKQGPALQSAAWFALSELAAALCRPRSSIDDPLANVNTLAQVCDVSESISAGPDFSLPFVLSPNAQCWRLVTSNLQFSLSSSGEAIMAARCMITLASASAARPSTFEIPITSIFTFLVCTNNAIPSVLLMP